MGKGDLLVELRRGTITIAVLAALQHERYGCELLKVMAARGFEIKEFTLYPLLRRLERQGLLLSEWRIEARPRRFFVLSDKGQAVLAEMLPAWRTLNATVEAIYKEGRKGKVRKGNPVRSVR